MPEDTIKRLYYSIGEVSERVDLEPHVLRYWETEFQELQPRKNRAGRRTYTDEDIAVLEKIKHLLKVDKYTIEGARQALADEKPISPTLEAELKAMRVFLANLLKSL